MNFGVIPGWTWWRPVASLVLLLAVQGCANTPYYWQSVRGHLSMMHAARPIQVWLDDPQTPATMRQRLQLVQAMRQFAVTELGLPDNSSYQRFADLKRRYVVWNVVAAPAFSLNLKSWCFPVAGCVTYRGYFDETDAQAHAAMLRHQGWEVSVYGVPAYSTLGWMNGLGGDPVLSTFANYPEGDLARVLFHELAHQVLYVPGDTAFNESFATAVERMGVARWLAAHGTPQGQANYLQSEQRRQALRTLTRATRDRLALVYKNNHAMANENKGLLAMKNEVLQDFRAAYAQIKAGWGGYAGFDAWVAQANNAAFGAQAAYDDLVPGFEALFVRQGRDWQRFFMAVKDLAQRPVPERARLLQQWALERNNG